MPHVIVKLWPGKSEPQKQQLADAIAQDVTFPDTHNPRLWAAARASASPARYRRARARPTGPPPAARPGTRHDQKRHERRADVVHRADAWVIERRDRLPRAGNDRAPRARPSPRATSSPRAGAAREPDGPGTTGSCARTGSERQRRPIAKKGQAYPTLLVGDLSPVRAARAFRSSMSSARRTT